MIYTLIHERDPIPCRTTYKEYRSPVNIFINFLRITTQFHWFSLQNMFFHSSTKFYNTSRGGYPSVNLKSSFFKYNIKRNWSLCGTGLNNRRLQQSSKTWEHIFSWIKTDSRKYSMYKFFFPIPEDAFILCIGFFWPIPEDAFGGRNYRFCILCMPSRLYMYMYNYMCMSVYIYMYMYMYVIFICICICICMLYLYVYVYVCVYLFVYVYT